MSTELLITTSPYAMRAALVSQGKPQTFFVEAPTKPSKLGDIHVARPLRFIPSLRACFVDIGDGREAFLRNAQSDLLASSAPLVVQVVSDAREDKLARVSRQVALPSRFLVFRPYGTDVKISRRIRNPHKLRALRVAISEAATDSGAVTVRAAAEEASSERLGIIAGMLSTRWRSLEASAVRDKTPRCLWSAGGLVGRLLRDIVPIDVSEILVDDRRLLQRVADLAGEEAPDISAALALYDTRSAPGSTGRLIPLFDRYDCAGRMADALDPLCTLPSGIRLTIEDTHAVTAIDVDTASATSGSFEAINAEASIAVGHEIVLRNLGGLIVIDFPGSDSARTRAAQLVALRQVLDMDSTPNRVLGATGGGLIEVTRRRFGPSLLEALTEQEKGSLGGRVPRLDAAAHDLAFAAQEEVANGVRRLTVRAEPRLLEVLAGPGGDALDRWLGAVITRVPDPSLARGRFVLEST